MQKRSKAKQKIHIHTEAHTHLLHQTLWRRKGRRLNWLLMAFIWCLQSISLLVWGHLSSSCLSPSPTVPPARSILPCSWHHCWPQNGSASFWGSCSLGGGAYRKTVECMHQNDIYKYKQPCKWVLMSSKPIYIHGAQLLPSSLIFRATAMTAAQTFPVWTGLRPRFHACCQFIAVPLYSVLD